MGASFSKILGAGAMERLTQTDKAPPEGGNRLRP